MAKRDRYDKLNHNALMASIGSMSRRWSDGMYVAPPQSIDDFFTTPGPNGLVIADEMGAAIRQVTMIDDAVRAASYLEPEPLDADVVGAMADELGGPRPESAAAAIAKISSINDALYQRLQDLSMNAWKQQAEVGSVSVTISDLAKGASRVNAERLAAATNVLQAVS